MIDLAIKKITGSNFINNPKKNIPVFINKLFLVIDIIIRRNQKFEWIKISLYSRTNYKWLYLIYRRI